MSRRKHENKIISEMNVVPYIDVMLVLLIIFMATAPMITQGIKVDLPNSDSSEVTVSDHIEPLIITVDKENNFYINRDDESSVVDFEYIVETYKEEKASGVDVKVFIRGDKSSNYGQIIKLMNELKNENIKEVGLVTEEVSN